MLCLHVVETNFLPSKVSVLESAGSAVVQLVYHKCCWHLCRLLAMVVGVPAILLPCQQHLNCVNHLRPWSHSYCLTRIVELLIVFGCSYGCGLKYSVTLLLQYHFQFSAHIANTTSSGRCVGHMSETCKVAELIKMPFEFWRQMWAEGTMYWMGYIWAPPGEYS